MRNRILVLFLILAALAGAFAYYLYSKPLADLNSSIPDFIMSADELLNTFEENEDEANSKYLDKIVQISGTIEKIEKSNNGNSVLLDAGSMMGYISFEMHIDQDLSKFAEGDEITLRGVCSGYLMDVVLNRAVVVE